jgi:hypothetical protein
MPAESSQIVFDLRGGGLTHVYQREPPQMGSGDFRISLMLVLRFSVRAAHDLNDQTHQGRYRCDFLFVVQCVPDCRVAVGPLWFEQAQLLHFSIPPRQSAKLLDPRLRADAAERQQWCGYGAID